MSFKILKEVEQDKDAELDWDMDWKAFLKSDTISTSTWITDLTEPQPSSFQDRKTKVWLSGGSCGQTYVVTNRIVTALGRKTDRSFRVKIVEK